MSEEKDNVLSISGKQNEEVTDINKYGNLKQLVERITGKNYVLAYIREEDGVPCIVPSEEMTPMEMVYLGELMKQIAMSGVGFGELEDE